MPVLTDDTVLNIDGFLNVDPAAGMRQRAESFLTSRRWSTSQVFYGDQQELGDEEEDEQPQPRWSMTFALGLDDIKTSGEDWFSDVTAMLGFVQTLQEELDNEFTAEVCYRFKPWYSEHITFVSEQKMDFSTVRAMIDHVT